MVTAVASSVETAVAAIAVNGFGLYSSFFSAVAETATVVAVVANIL